jgi:hypothetical protein
MDKCRKPLSSRRVEDGMGKDPGYCRTRVGQMKKPYRHNTLTSDLNLKARRVVTNIIPQSDRTGAIAEIFMARI